MRKKSKCAKTSVKTAIGQQTVTMITPAIFVAI
jgi:hypothetical protein